MPAAAQGTRRKTQPEKDLPVGSDGVDDSNKGKRKRSKTADNQTTLEKAKLKFETRNNLTNLQRLTISLSLEPKLLRVFK